MRATLVLLAIGLLGGGISATGRAQVTRPADPGAPTASRSSGSRLANPAEALKRLGIGPEYQGIAGVESLKIAVLDYGFEGLGSGRGYLPESSVIVEHYDPEFVRRNNLGDPEFRKGFEPGNRHGRIMAQIVWAVTGSRPGGPRFYLLNANGPTMLRRAVRYAIEQRVDLILFSGSFEGGGNGDGRGPIDRIVADALAADILWINAAGNYGRRVFNGPVRVLPDGYLRLRDGRDVASLRFRNRVDENTVTVTLTWNDYREVEDAGTDKDLDLFVEDPSGRVVGSSHKVQVSGPGEPGPDQSRNPRERVVLADLPAVPEVSSDPDYAYRIRIKASRGRFTSADRVRVLVSATKESYVAPGGAAPREAIEFLDASGEGEIYPPADHPLVLTVGDADPSSSIGPTLDRRVKPDVVLEDSRAFFTDGGVSAGSSDAAAYVAGAVALLRAADPGLAPRHLAALVRGGPALPSTARARGKSASTTVGPRLWQMPSRARLAQAVRGGRSSRP